MNAALELHDSEVAEVKVGRDTLRIVFDPAYVHRSSGRPGIDAGDGFLQPAQLIFSEASWSGLPAECRGTVSDGSLLVDEKSLGLVPCPLQVSGEIAARIEFTSGKVLTVEAKGLACELLGPGRWLEAYAG